MRKILYLLLMLVLSCNIAFAEDITITSSVDRTEVEFGDRIQLTLQIKRPLTSQGNTRTLNNGGFSFSFNSFNMMGGMDDIDFNIENIPDFDILGRSTSQQSRSINGKGESVKQITLSIVPQKIGELIIPAFSIKDKDGQEHTSQAIKIKVNEVAKDPDEEGQASTSSSSNEDDEDSNAQLAVSNTQRGKDNSFNSFNLMLGFGLGLVLVVLIIMFVAYMAGNSARRVADKSSAQTVEDAVIVKEEKKAENVQPAKPVAEAIDFDTATAKLKAQYKEVSSEFYKKYFEIFKKACCNNQNISMDMTYTELLNKCKDIAGTSNIRDAADRLADEIELVMYANRMPQRQLTAINSDIREILNSL